MKKIVYIFIIAIMVCLIAGCTQKTVVPINLPEKSVIQSIDIIIGDETENHSDSEWINQCISSITDAQATSKASIQELPQVDEFIQININTDNAISTIYVYMEKGNYYIEQTYQGIYKTDLTFYEMLTGEK